MQIGFVLAFAAIASALVLILLVARSHGRSKELEALRELGFATVEKPPDGLLEALRLLCTNGKAKITVAQALSKRSRAADLYFLHLTIAEDEENSYRQTLRSLYAYNPSWGLPEVAVVTLRDPEGWAERMVGKALQVCVGKRLSRLEVMGLGDFSKHAFIFGKSEPEARRILTHSVQRALGSLPYNLLETRGSLLVMGRPAQAGKGSGSQEDWRQLMDVTRTVAEEMATVPRATVPRTTVPRATSAAPTGKPED